MKEVLIVLLLMLTSHFASAQEPCKTEKPDAPLQNTRWKLVAIAGMDSLPALQKDAWLQFEAGTNRYRGNAGCNNFNGSYTTGAGQVLTFLPAAMTRMACQDPLMKVENGFIHALTETLTYSIHGDVLTLMHNQKVLARFEALYLR